MAETKQSAGILGLGSYVPERILTNADLEKIVDTSDEWIFSRTGIKQRHVADEATATSDIAAGAAKRALAHAGIKAEELDLIIVATATPDMFFPSTACLVQEKIGATHAAAFDLAAGCSGFVYGLTVATQFIQAGLYQRVLVIGAETLSKILDWTDRNTCVLFGDGAGAAVIGPVPAGYGVLGVELGADGHGGELLKMPAGGSRRPPSAETVAQRLHYVHMNGNEVFKFAIKVMGEAAQKALQKAGMTDADVDYLIPHQANIRIIQSAAKRLQLPMEKVHVNVDRYGNTSAASIPIALEEAVLEGKVKNGDKLVLVGFGAGLTWAACVLRWYKEDSSVGE
ncbi:beta-ketoacyl-ACP synthase III [Anaeromusa sp.]|uniref:beta-ketoacyl-ACP synthase III n=1 Tax=Anaeromusa sp. TaxID=1872520 RepID=UPI0029C61CBF|nr:beta-ketoacyl-ACP synthase III [Anaeromusa sp.]MEA4833641.1 beta-ketoacyl-ACP synthase III [Anaeromusa sp.]